MSTATILGFQNLLEPILKEWFYNEYLEIPSMYPELYSVESSEKTKETLLGIAGGTGFQKFTGVVSEDSLSEAYKVEITHDEWTDSFSVQYKLYRDDQYGIMKQNAQELARLAKATKEETAFDLFNHAFDTTYTGGDSLALCSTAHTTPVSGVANQSNSGTSALSHASFVATRTAMRKFYNWSGRKILVQPDAVLVPVDLETSAREIMQSQLKDANNTVNVISSTYKPKIFVSEYLDDANNWFMLDTRLMKKHLKWYNREPLKLMKDSSVNTLVLKEVGYYRCGFGFGDYRWIYGHNVS